MTNPDKAIEEKTPDQEAAEYLLAHPDRLRPDLLGQLLEALAREQSSRLRCANEQLVLAIRKR